MSELSKTHIVHFFDDASEYCAFIRLLMQGKVKHHFACRAQFPAIYKVRGVGYCEKYEGLYGHGWRIVLFRAGKGYHNNIVKYYIVGEPKHSNQLDSRNLKGVENERVHSKFSREVQRRKSDDD